MAKTQDPGKTFFQKHCNMFKGYIFKFNGLEEDTEAFFIKTVKDLGATVSDDAVITFVDLPSCDVQSDDLYSLVYIWDSIEAGKALALDKYRFHRHGMDCEKSDEETRNNIISDEYDKHLVENPLHKNAPNWKQKQVTNTKVKQGQEFIREKQTPSEIKTGRMQIKKELTSARSYSPSDSEVEEILNVEDDDLDWSKESSLLNKKSTKSHQLRAGSPDSYIPDSSDEETAFQNSKQWWLPHDIPSNKLCRVENCTFEPGDHESHLPPSRRMSDTEKKIVLKYLIRHNKISSAKGVKIFEEMYDSGYLTHRSADTLRNNMRRTILNNLYQFNLPSHIRSQFQHLRY